MQVLKLVVRPVMKWAARRTLVGRNRSPHHSEHGRFTRAEVDRLLAEAWRTFDAHAPAVPREPTVGNSMNMLLACATVSFFSALRAAGIERGYAITLCADAAWQVYAKWGILPRCIARSWTADPVARLRIPVNMFLRFPFNPPGYVLKRLPAADGVSFDILRCPVAEYLRAQGAADLCVESWCNLDYGLAEMWGGRLERSGTLARGDACCDFRFKARR